MLLYHFALFFLSKYQQQSNDLCLHALLPDQAVSFHCCQLLQCLHSHAQLVIEQIRMSFFCSMMKSCHSLEVSGLKVGIVVQQGVADLVHALQVNPGSHLKRSSGQIIFCVRIGSSVNEVVNMSSSVLYCFANATCIYGLNGI